MIVITSNLGSVAARLTRIAEESVPAMEATRLGLATRARALIVPIIADHTPRVTGHLAESTTGDVSPEGVVFRQPAESAPNQDGSGGGIHYVKFVVQGRGDVFPINKKALAGPNFGPVAHAGPAAPNPYPDAAMRDAELPLEALLAEEGHGIIATLMTTL